MTDEEDPREYAPAHQAWFTGVAGRYYVRRAGNRVELRPESNRTAPSSFQQATGALLLEAPSDVYDDDDDIDVCGRISMRGITGKDDVFYELKLILESWPARSSNLKHKYFKFILESKKPSSCVIGGPGWVEGSLKLKVAALTDAGGQEVLVGHLKVKEGRYAYDGVDDGNGSPRFTTEWREVVRCFRAPDAAWGPVGWPGAVLLTAEALCGGATENEASFVRALKFGDAPAVERCLNAGASPELIAALPREPPLLHAAQLGHVDVVRVLLDHGASLQEVDDRNPLQPLPRGARFTGTSALWVACASGQVEVAALLLDRGADPFYTTSEAPITPLWAAAVRSTPCLRLLIDRGVDIDALTHYANIRRGERRQNHLHYACRNNYPDLARALLLHGADMFCANDHFKDYRTPLEVVREVQTWSHMGDTSELVELFDRAAPSHWRRLFALTFGQMKTCTELAGQRIAPLIGAFLVGDVLQKKQERSVVGLA